MSTQTHLDQLDILSTYMGYWIEFKDKERVYQETVPELAIKCDGIFNASESVQIQIGNGNRHKTFKGIYGEYAREKKTPTTFKSILKVHSELIRLKHKTPKQSVIKSIQKFV